MSNYRRICILAVSLMLNCALLHFMFYRANVRTSALLDIVEADLAENQRKDAVRDQWMREHQGDLMIQIEARMK